MTNEKEISRLYKEDAKRITDMMFDAKTFHEGMTRDSIQGFEDLIAWHFQSHIDKYIRDKEFTNRIEKLRKPVTNQTES